MHFFATEMTAIYPAISDKERCPPSRLQVLLLKFDGCVLVIGNPSHPFEAHIRVEFSAPCHGDLRFFERLASLLRWEV